MRILIVDDDRRHGESLAELLATRGHEAYFAPTLSEAEWLIELFRFDLSVVDLEMPSMPGPEVARRLRQRVPELEVVIVSGGRPPEPGPEPLLYPFFPKPLDPERFLAFLEGLLSVRLGLPLVLRGRFPLVRQVDS